MRLKWTDLADIDLEKIEAHIAKENSPLVAIDVTPFLGKAEKINITVPSLVLRQIDRYVQEHPAEARSRSAFLTEAALERMRKGHSSVSA